MKKLLFGLGLIILILFPIPQASSQLSAQRNDVYQNNWSGGVDNSVVKYYNLRNWTKYSSSNQVTLMPDLGRLFPNEGATNPYVISSPIDIETGELVSVYGSTGVATITVRQADDITGLASAAWFSINPARVNKRYMQYKVAYGRMGEERVNLVFASLGFSGTVKDVSGKVMEGWKLCGEGDCNSVVLMSQIEQGEYYLALDYNRGQSLTKTLTASAPGYVSKSVAVTASHSLIFGLGSGGGYSGVYNFVLEKITASTPTNSSSTTVTQTAQNQSITPPPVLGGVGAPEKPAPETVKLVLGNEVLGKDEIPKKPLELGKSYTFQGVTMPNAIVYLFFHSEEFVAKTIADKDGKWTYELTKDLGSGDHEVQLAVTDPVTKLTSEKSEPIKFAIAAAFDGVRPNPAQNTVNWPRIIWALSALFVVLTVIFITILTRRVRRKI